MTVADRDAYEKDAGAGFPLTHKMTPAESTEYNLTARKIYFGLKENAKIGDRKEQREHREAINNSEVDLTYELSVTHDLPGYKWDDGFSVEIVEQKIPERGEERPPALKVFYETK